ncbi:MAG TPA: hypothetical protein VK589_00775 [Chryseolinea sp.]|nr:hypothetical protein [Chryseolinea sp.]
MSRKLQAASNKLHASITEPKASSCTLQAWDGDLKLQCKSLRLAFELEAHLMIVQQQTWFRENTIETRLTLTIEEQKMLTTFINRL